METITEKEANIQSSGSEAVPVSREAGGALYQRRKKVVPDALGIFNPSSVQSAHGAVMIDADGNELIDFAGDRQVPRRAPHLGARAA